MKNIIFNFVDLKANIDAAVNPILLTVYLLLKDLSYIESDLSFKYEVIHNKKVIFKTNRTKDMHFEFRLPHSGAFVVRVWGFQNGKDINYIQKTVFAYGKEQKEEYKRFLKQTSAALFTRNELPLYLYDSPNQIMAVIATDEIFMKKIQSESEQLSLRFSLYGDSLSNKRKIATVSQTGGSNEVLFSGKAIYKDKLIIGEADVTTKVVAEKLAQCTGDFTIIYKQGKKIIYANDIYGLNKIFYYKNEKILIASNSYHLLLKLLVSVEEKLEIDCALAAIPLISKDGLFMQQKFSHNMDIMGVHLVPIDSYLEIDSNSINVIAKSWKLALDGNVPLKSYDELMVSAVDELKANITTLFSDPRYKNKIIDITGGKDSRLIVAAISTLNKSLRDNLYFHYNYANDDEAKIVTGLRSLLKAKWEVLPEKLIAVSASKYEEFNRSCFMGLTFSRGYTTVIRNHSKPIYLNLCGGGGDGLYRPYFGMLYSNVDCSGTVDTVAENILMYLGNDSAFSIESVKDKFVAEYKETISEIAGESLFEKMNNHYFYFRNSTHFGSQFAMNSNQTERDYWHPLMTDSIVLLLHEFLKKESSLRLQMEITARINPDVLQYPYEDKKDRLSYINYGKKLGLVGLSQDVPNMDLADYKNSLIEKRKNIHVENRILCPDIMKKENEEYKAGFFNRLEENLMKVYSYHGGIIRDILGIELFFYYKEREKLFRKTGKIEKRDIYLYNKIASIVDQIEIINPGKDWFELSK